MLTLLVLLACNPKTATTAPPQPEGEGWTELACTVSRPEGDATSIATQCVCPATTFSITPQPIDGWIYQSESYLPEEAATWVRPHTEVYENQAYVLSSDASHAVWACSVWIYSS